MCGIVICGMVLWLSMALQAVSPEAVRHAQAGTDALNQGRLHDAIEEFRKVTELAPDLPQAFASLGQAYMQNGEYETAIAPLQRALELNQDLTIDSKMQ